MKIVLVISLVVSSLLASRPLEAQIPIIDDVIEGLEDAADWFYEGVGALPGILIAGGQLYIQGPTGLIPALIAGHAVSDVVNLLINQRPISTEEYAFAQTVFGDTLPPRERIILTNLSGMEGRAFVVPDKLVGGNYLVNIGNAFSNPAGAVYPNHPKPGQLLIHELTHVWQLYNASLVAEQQAQAIFTQIADGRGAYGYQCGQPWTSYNPEQQAGIVEDRYETESPCHYRYVVENVRKGRFTPRHASSGGTVAAVSRIPERMEVWWVEKDGAIEAASWYEGATWLRYQLAPAGQAATKGGITAVSRIPTSLEVWWIGANGSVQGAYWYEGGTWQRYELSPAGSAAVAGGISAISRIPNTLELWWTGANGSLQGAFWYEGGTWQRYELAPAGSASAVGQIAAVSRVPQSMELWWIGANGSVEAAYWYEGGAWQRYQLAPRGQASLESGIAAVSRISQGMELWWVAPNGSVQDAYWYEGGSWQRFELAPPGSAHKASPFAAVSRIPSSMELWWAQADGVLRGAFWYEGNHWQTYSLTAPDQVSNGGGVAAVSRIPGSMEVWTAGPTAANASQTDGHFWYEGGAWDHYNLAVARRELTREEKIRISVRENNP